MTGVPVRIAMPDGVELVGDLYLPPGTGIHPAVLELTPYRAADRSKAGAVYTARGFIYLAVDARGRYRSDGRWEPLEDLDDCAVVVDWLRGQPRCNGRVGARGHSYAAHAALRAADEAGLEAVVSLSAHGPAFRGGAFDVQRARWLTEMAGRLSESPQDREEWGAGRFGSWSSENIIEPTYDYELHAPPPPDPDPDPSQEEIDALQARPFSELDLRLGVRSETLRRWLAADPSFWRSRTLPHAPDAPCLLVSGWWDPNAAGTAQLYREDLQQQLVIGPWTDRAQAPDLRDLPEEEARLVTRAAQYDSLNDELAFFDHHLKDVPFGPSQAPVRLFATGEYRWREYQTWPPADAETWQLCFDAGSKSLAEESPTAGQVSLDLKQSDPSPHGPAWVAGRPRPFDSAEATADRTDIVSFETETLTSPHRLVGPAEATVFASSDRPTFDVCVRLLDVYPDGRAIWLADGVQRVGAEVQAVHVDLLHLGHVLRVGHKLRVEVAPAAFMRWDVNPGVEGNPWQGVEAEDTRVTIRTGADTASCVRLTVESD